MNRPIRRTPTVNIAMIRNQREAHLENLIRLDKYAASIPQRKAITSLSLLDLYV